MGNNMHNFSERLEAAKKEVIVAITTDQKSIVFDTLTAELLVEAVTDLLELNKELTESHNARLMKMTLKHRDRIAKVREDIAAIKKKNDRLSVENRNLKQFRRNHEEKMMGAGKDELYSEN